MFLWTSGHSFGQGQLEEKDRRENVSGGLHTDLQLYKINASKGSENIILLSSSLPPLETKTLAASFILGLHKAFYIPGQLI